MKTKTVVASSSVAKMKLHQNIRPEQCFVDVKSQIVYNLFYIHHLHTIVPLTGL